MYLICHKRTENELIRFTRESEIALFGCNRGLFAREVRRTLPAGQDAPYRWHINVPEAVASEDGEERAVVIDIKPNNEQDVTLCELLDVWGDTREEWTPLLLRMRGLVLEPQEAGFDKADFAAQKLDSFHDSIFSILYVDGTVSEGELRGRWLPPRPSPTNAALLWPVTLQYFLECIRDTSPEVLPSLSA